MKRMAIYICEESSIVADDVDNDDDIDVTVAAIWTEQHYCLQQGWSMIYVRDCIIVLTEL